MKTEKEKFAFMKKKVRDLTRGDLRAKAENALETAYGAEVIGFEDYRKGLYRLADVKARETAAFIEIGEYYEDEGEVAEYMDKAYHAVCCREGYKANVFKELMAEILPEEARKKIVINVI